MRSYRPRRASKRWLEGAPDYVLSCHDNKGKTIDRYTVCFGGSLWSPELGRNVFCLDMSPSPSHPQGVSMISEVPSHARETMRKVRWLDLPEHIREHVIMRAETEF
jgi:hypothetical protein